MTFLWDDLGEYVAVQGIPNRVVSLVPSITEAIAASAASRLIGATDYCVYPKDLDVIRVGGSKYPRINEVMSLSPDLVIANSEENRVEDVGKLRANGIPVWVMAAPTTVPMALGSLRRLLTQVFDVTEPKWLTTAEYLWRTVKPARLAAIVPVWRRPWVVLGRDTFAGDVLRRLGIRNVYASHQERYPRPSLSEMQALIADGQADLVVLPDEPYAFTEEDGPDAFPGARCVFLSGRHLTWYGPSLVEARKVLADHFHNVLPQGYEIS